MNSKTQFQMVQDAWSEFENKGQITGDTAPNLLSVVSDLKEREAILGHKVNKLTFDRDKCISLMEKSWRVGFKYESHSQLSEWVEMANRQFKIKDELEAQPTIRDYIKTNEESWKKCHRNMIDIDSLYEFIGEVRK